MSAAVEKDYMAENMHMTPQMAQMMQQMMQVPQMMQQVMQQMMQMMPQNMMPMNSQCMMPNPQQMMSMTPQQMMQQMMPQMPQMPQISQMMAIPMPAPLLMAQMTCEMVGDGIVLKMKPVGDVTMDMMKTCCERLNQMMEIGMPTLVSCGGVPMAVCTQAKK